MPKIDCNRLSKQSGSTHIAIIMAVVVMTLVGFTGYRLLTTGHADNSTNEIVGASGKCLDNSNNRLANGNLTQYYTCNGLATQQWEIADDGTIKMGNGYCLNVVNGAITSRSRVDIYSCNGSPSERWGVKSDGTVVNSNSGLCLDNTNGWATNGNPIQIYTCNGLTTQQWKLRAALTPPPSTGWTNVLNDQFNSGSLPSHWASYTAKYGGDSHNCATPNHAIVSSGYLHLLMAYDNSGVNASAGCTGNQWYTAGIYLPGSRYETQNFRVTMRWRIVRNGVIASHVYPLRYAAAKVWPDNEEDWCESAVTTLCGSNFHWNSGTATQPINSQKQYRTNVDLTQWHTMRSQRAGQRFTLWIDDMTNPIIDIDLTTTQAKPAISRIILQQECNYSGCPRGTVGSEDDQIDWVIIDTKA